MTKSTNIFQDGSFAAIYYCQDEVFVLTLTTFPSMIQMQQSFFVFVLQFVFLINLHGQVLRTTATANSVGYYLEDLSTLSSRFSVQVKFSKKGESSRVALPPSLLVIANERVIAGSLLQLEAATDYEVNVEVVDSFPSLKTYNFSQSIRIEALWVPKPSNDTLWVAHSGSGNLYTKTQPGSIQVLFNSQGQLLKCGTIVMCKAGRYYVGELNWNLSNAQLSCNTGGQSITIQGEQGAAVVFDGADSSFQARYPTWKLVDTSNKIYQTFLPTACSYSNLVLYQDSIRLFPYACIYPAQFFLNGKWFYESLSNAANYFGSGYYREGNNFYIKLANGESPNGKPLTVSKYNSFLNLYNYSNPKLNQSNVVFRNLSIRNYGKSNIVLDFFGNVTAEYDANALYFRDISNVVIDNCYFAYNTQSVTFDGKTDRTLVQNCRFKDQTGKWMHGQFKNTSLSKTGDINFIDNKGKWGRSLEKAAIFFEMPPNSANSAAIVRNNVIDGYVSGIAGRQRESSPFYDIDIHDNTIRNTYDAIDIVGNAVNYRVWNNSIESSPVIFSMIPFTDNGIPYGNLGPAYFFRNKVRSIVQRKNLTNLPNHINPELYVNYNGCEGGVRLSTWGLLLKMETGTMPAFKRQDIFFLHNTVLAQDSLAFDLHLGKPTWRSLTSTNNLYYSKYNCLGFDGVQDVKPYHFVSQTDNYYTEGNRVGSVNGMHGNLNTCFRYADLVDVETKLKQLTGELDTSKLRIRSFQFEPKLNFVNLNLDKASPLINRGTIVPNISDLPNSNYYDSFPDIGAVESTTSIANDDRLATACLVLYPNPTDGPVQLILDQDFNFPVEVTVINAVGATVFQQQQVRSGQLTIDASTFDIGFYIVVIRGQDGRLLHGRLAKM